MKLPQELNLEFKGYAYSAFGISLAALFLSLIAQKYLPPKIPLFYGQPEGEEQLAPALALVLPSLFSLVLLTLNSGLSLLTKDDFLKKALVLTTVVVSIFAAITTLKIVFLVGSFR